MIEEDIATKAQHGVTKACDAAGDDCVNASADASGASIPNDITTDVSQAGITEAVAEKIEDCSRGLIPGNVSIRNIRAEPAWKVVNTFELLEQILSYLPAADLAFSITSVCKGFRTVVEKSPTLLKLCYRRPLPQAPYVCFADVLAEGGRSLRGV